MKYKQELREKITNMQETADGKSWCNDPEAISTAKAAMEIIKELEEIISLQAEYSSSTASGTNLLEFDTDKVNSLCLGEISDSLNFRNSKN